MIATATSATATAATAATRPITLELRIAATSPIESLAQRAWTPPQYTGFRT